jgi:hypothetical protein
MEAFDEDAAALRAWLAAGEPRSVFLVVGVPGSGVSTLLTKVLEALDIESVWLGPGTPRLRVAMADAGCSVFSATGRRKVVVVEGFDALIHDASSAADVVDAIKRQLPAPTVFLAHRTRTVRRRFEELFSAATRARATVLEMRPMSAPKIAEILRNRYPTADPAVVAALAHDCRGDLRSALASLAFSEESVHTKDEVPEAEGVVDDLLAGGAGLSVREILAVAAGDASVISHGLFERYGYGPEVADAFSVADIIEERMFSTQRWELSDVHAVMAVATPALRLDPAQVMPAAVQETKKKFVYGMVWSRMHLLAARRKLVQTVHTQRALATRPRLDVPDLGLVRRILSEAVTAWSPEVIRRVTHGLRPDAILAIMRLWKGRYTLAMHGRVSRLLADSSAG